MTGDHVTSAASNFPARVRVEDAHDEAALIKRARDLYQEPNQVEIDDDAQISVSDDPPEAEQGAWVQAWVWVPNE